VLVRIQPAESTKSASDAVDEPRLETGMCPGWHG
jgi:hypothetical protein